MEKIVFKLITPLSRFPVWHQYGVFQLLLQAWNELSCHAILVCILSVTFFMWRCATKLFGLGGDRIFHSIDNFCGRKCIVCCFNSSTTRYDKSSCCKYKKYLLELVPKKLKYGREKMETAVLSELLFRWFTLSGSILKFYKTYIRLVVPSIGSQNNQTTCLRYFQHCQSHQSGLVR